MAYEFKKLSDVNILEEKKDGLNVLVEDAGEIVKISNDDLNPANFYMVVDTTYHYGKEKGSIIPYFQEPISTVVNKIQSLFNKTVLARGILSSSGITTYNSIGSKLISQDDGTLDAIVYYNDLHPLYLSSSKNTITLLEGWEEPAHSIPAPATAEVGQVIAVKAVDENGKPTEWEAVDIDDVSSGKIVTYYYTSNDEYIYRSAEGAYRSNENNRVTNTELVTNLKNNAMIIMDSVSLVSGVIESRARKVPHSFDWSMNPFVTVYLFDFALYTAEYTPGPR